MKLPVWLAALFSAVAALLPACDVVNLPQIQPGITTADEVRTRMGEPGFIHWDDDGTATWEYSRQPAGVDCYMIRFDRTMVVARFEQVLVPATYAEIRPGMSKDDVRRRLGQPASKTPFANLGEEIWEWHVRGDIPMDETWFMVHFDLQNGSVKRTSQRIQPKA